MIDIMPYILEYEMIVREQQGNPEARAGLIDGLVLKFEKEFYSNMKATWKKDGKVIFPQEIASFAEGLLHIGWAYYIIARKTVQKAGYIAFTVEHELIPQVSMTTFYAIAEGIRAGKEQPKMEGNMNEA